MKNSGVTVEQIEKDLLELNGNMAAVARKHGLKRGAIWDRVQRNDRLKKAQHDARESMKDDAESSLHAALKAGEAWAVCFYLKTQARDRGYNEKDSVSLPIPLEAILNELPPGDAETIRGIIAKAFAGKRSANNPASQPRKS